MDLFNRSFHFKLFVLLGMSVLLLAIFYAGILTAIALAPVHGLLTFLGIVAVLVFINKFMLVLPAMIIGNMSFERAFAYSFRHITVGRCFKLFGIELLSLIAFIIIAVIVSLISMIFMFIPVLGQLIYLAIQIALGGFFTSLIIAVMLGLYYRYSSEAIPQQTENMQAEN